MKARVTEAGHLLLFVRGEEFVAELVQYCQRQNIKSAWLSGLGAFSACELGFYDLAQKAYHFTTFNSDMEVTALTGNIAAKDGELLPHIHVTVADKDFKALGGHLKSGVVAGTLEILLTPFSEPLARQLDPETGLNTLNL